MGGPQIRAVAARVRAGPELRVRGRPRLPAQPPLDTPLYGALDEAVAAVYPGARAVPVIAPGAADSRYFRTRGIPAYGFGMFSPRWRHADFRHLVHSVDERIDVESVGLAVHAIERVVRRVLG